MLMDGGVMVRAICARLKSTGKFTGMVAYTERITQDMKRPCFFVQQMTMNQTKSMFNSYTREYRMKVSYVPLARGTEQERELRACADILCETLTYLPLSGMPNEGTDAEPVFAQSAVRPTNFDVDIMDGMTSKELRFTMDIRCRCLDVASSIPMQVMTYNPALKPYTL